MPKTKKTVQLQNLANYKVYIEDTSLNSDYFNVTNIPPKFTGGKNSFLMAGSEYLIDGSDILIEVLDADGNTIFQNSVIGYIEGTSILTSIEIYDTTPAGFCTIILVGKAETTVDGSPIPPNWKNTYNIRWTRKVLVEPNLKNTSHIIFEDFPIVFTEEKLFYNVATSSFAIENLPFSASLTSLLESGIPTGYVINTTTPVSFSADYYNPIITGSIIVNGISGSISLPITKILNTKTGFTRGYTIKLENGNVIDSIYLQNGKYSTTVFGQNASVTSSFSLQTDKLKSQNVNIPISYAKIRVGKINTVSGEIFKAKVYNKVATNVSDYKLLAEIPLTTSELLVSSSIQGDLPIGNFNILPSASASWYADALTLTNNPIYPISASTAYNNYLNTITPFDMYVRDDILLRSVYVQVPLNMSTNKFANSISESGYFIGNKQPVILLPTTEYTLQLDAYYRKTSGSVSLTGKTPKVDIYIMGLQGTNVTDLNPLGQKIGELTVASNQTNEQWYETKQFNFTPELSEAGKVGVKFVIQNGFWNFSNISLKPASDELFSPDETQFLIPNLENRNEYLQYKVDFYDINSNSTNVMVESIPTLFTGSAIDLGTLP